jgi:serine/threonine protein kinase/tetratricopeptide (TPR) repeat protein
MTPDRWQQIEQLYHGALERAEEQRAGYLQQACAGDDGLRCEVESLLARDDATLLQSMTTQLAGALLGPYRIEAPIGAGGMGEVFRAHDTRLHRNVAIKILPRGRMADPDRKRRFLQEARAASALNHPNIVVIYDISSDAGTDFLVMEYVQGQTLKDLIAADGLPFHRVTEYGVQIASALASAHCAGIVHRDIKPANIMVTPNHQVKVLDFGIAKLVNPLPGSQARSVDGTIPGTLVGTIAYMSPEQTRGESVDARTDIFSLGSVLYQAATGALPFNGASVLAIMHEIAVVEPPAPSHVCPNLSHAFDAVIKKCLAKNAEQRFARMEDVAFALGFSGGGSGRPVTEASPSVPAIAVMPFSNLSGDAENEYFGDGLAEELINELARIDALQVTARSSSFAFRGKALDVREIGKVLNVTVILEGSVRRIGNRLRVSAQLINVSDGYHLWSERYDREMTDLFDIQDDISSAIMEKLRPRLSRKGDGLPLKRQTEDPEAYSLYLKGRYYWEKRPAGTWRAIESFEQAIECDPKYALAYAGLADAYNTLASWEGGILPPREGFAKGLAYAEQALQLDPELAQGHAALGYVLLHNTWDIHEAERRFTDAIRLNPRYGPAHHWYSHLLVAGERLEESLSESIAYLKADPADQFSLVHMSWHYLMTHEFDKALVECRRALRDEPNFAWHHVFHGWALLDSNQTAEAEAEIRRGAELSGGPSVILTSLAHAQAVAGHQSEARQSLDRLAELSKSKYVSPYEIGLVHEALGDRAEAFRCWERAYEERSPWLVYLAREHRLRHLHGMPKFESLVARIRKDLQCQTSPDDRAGPNHL